MNHLLRRQWLEMAALALLCLGLLSRPQAAAQGFADGARLCVGSLLPALFPFMVVCELLVGMALPKALLRPQARLLGLQNEDTAAALLASWLGGYAVCARLTAQLRVAGRISARDAALLMMLGCCSGPGFVVGYIGGLLLGSTSLGALLYAGQLAANLLALYRMAPEGRAALGAKAKAYYEAHYRRTELLRRLESFTLRGE